METSKPDDQATIALSAKRILCLDDSLETVDFYKLLLERAGYECLITTNEQWALAILRTLPIDLLIQDIKHPGMGGWTFLHKLKADPVLRHIPVLIITAASKTSEAWHLEEYGSVLAGYLEEPTDPAELLEAVQHTLSP